MNDYQDVISKVYRNIAINSIPLILTSLILIAIVIFIIKKGFELKGVVALLSIIIVICISYVVVEFAVFSYEINNDKYLVTYHGKFKYTSVLSHTGDQVNLLDNNNDRLNCVYMDVEDGVYEGDVVYTKWSRWVLDIDSIR